MADPPLLALTGIRFHLGDQTILDGVDLGIAPGERLSLVGRNGAGKSTLLRILAGQPIFDGGTRFAQPGATIATLPQEPDFAGHASVADYVASVLPDSLGPSDYRIAAILEEMKLDGDRQPGELSGGEARRAALARVLVGEPDVMLLDEPTNHLDLPTIEWLEEKLSKWRGAYVLVSHDRRFLTTLSRAVLWLDRGIVRRLDRGYGEFEAWSTDIIEREATERHKLDRLIERETEWAGKSIRARRTRNEGRLRALNALRQQRREQIGPVGRATIEAGQAEASGALVVTARNISKRWGEKVIVEDFSTRIFRKNRIGLIGPNGAGKTTLLKMLMGELAPDSGTVKLGANLLPVVIDQRRIGLDPDKTPWEILADRNDHVLVRGHPTHVMTYLREYLFRDEQARQPVRTLSGGERNRLLLAKALAAPSNMIVLDEPTNDLDADTLDLLQEALADYDGTVLLVSHDRDFLDRLVTSTIALEGDGTAVEYAGGYSDYVSQRGPRVEPTGVTPSRARQKPAAPRENGSVAKRLGYKRERALVELPKKIDALHAEMAAIHTAMADPALYSRDPKAFAAKSARLGAAQAELEAAETEWLELEMLKEELGS
ncbi:MAG: ATP-binding cassette domain-containing protein [Reyranella sp.]|uniref:ABC-F family ATP-binding cassette domain-containing protein n=1 Tax=Reyranella sp. TaxID=1929291 RepID=UPI0011FF62EA|nr:ATP-binding cassette domain-containing protein [Reyranella sp.]TAJ38840.1 MAG: ATP-binding cassette domain-containing protein [Reyranella sp.]